MFNTVGEQAATEHRLSESTFVPRARGGSCISIDVEYGSGFEPSGVESADANPPSLQMGHPLNIAVLQHPRAACDDVLSNSGSEEGDVPNNIELNRSGASFPGQGSIMGLESTNSKARKEESSTTATSRPPRGNVSRQPTQANEVYVRVPRGPDIYRRGSPQSRTAGLAQLYGQVSPPGAVLRHWSPSQVPSHKYTSDDFRQDAFDNPDVGYSAQCVSDSVAENWSSDEEDEAPASGDHRVLNVNRQGVSVGCNQIGSGNSVAHKEFSFGVELPVSTSEHHFHDSWSPSSTCHSHSPYVYAGKDENRHGSTSMIGSTVPMRLARSYGDRSQVETSAQRSSKNHGKEPQRGPKSLYRHHSELDITDSGASGVLGSHDGRRLEDIHASSPAFLMASSSSIFGTKDSIFGSMYDIVIPPSPLDTQDAQMIEAAQQQQTKGGLGCVPIRYPKLNPLAWLFRRKQRNGRSQQVSDSSKQLMRTIRGGSESAQMAAANARGIELYKRRHAVLRGRMEAVLEETKRRTSIQLRKSKDKRRGPAAAANCGSLKCSGPKDLDTAFHAISAGPPPKEVNK